jgi:hypothetical protein
MMGHGCQRSRYGEWHLAESKKSDTPDISAGDLVNIYVVEDGGNPIKYYATNQFEVFNQIDTEI